MPIAVVDGEDTGFAKFRAGSGFSQSEWVSQSERERLVLLIR